MEEILLCPLVHCAADVFHVTGKVTPDFGDVNLSYLYNIRANLSYWVKF
jgi:hypothetical protein